MTSPSPALATDLRIVPSAQAAPEDLEAIFDRPGDQRSCRCQWTRLPRADWRAMPEPERAQALREQAGCGRGEEAEGSGLIAYVDGVPAGWVAVEPRPVYRRLQAARIPWAGRSEDKEDESVWAVTCFVVAREFRGRGLTRALAIAAVAHARSHGARAVEGYPVVVGDGPVAAGELFVGTVGAFEAAGLEVVSTPTPRRAVMRRDLAPDGPSLGA